MSANSVFSEIGGVSVEATRNTTPIIATLVIGNVVKTDLKVLNITLATSADLQIAKSLNGSYILTEFGDSPVIIELSGLQINETPCLDTADILKSDIDIEAVYHRYKISSKRRRKVLVGMSSRSTYSGYMTSLTLDPYGKEKINGVSYRLRIIAVYTGA